MPKVVIVTGASSGIGRALSLAWAREKALLVLGGRNEAALAEVAREVVSAGGQALIEAGDVTGEDHRRALVARAMEAGGRIDVLVNNAGRGYYEDIGEVDIDALAQLFALNASAPLRLAQLSTPGLAKAGGTIVMVSSIAGVVVAPRMGAYAASKYALEALSLALRTELSPLGIRVLVVRPGPVDTPFRKNAVTSQPEERGVRPTGARVQSPEEVAARTLRAVARGSAVLETSAFVKVASFGSRVVPSIVRRFTSKMTKSR